MVVAFTKRENTDLPLLKQQLTKTAQGIQNMLNAIQQGILTSSTKTRLDELEETKAQLEVSILQAELEKPLISREQLLFWLHRFRGIDTSNPVHRQRLVDSFVNAVYLYDDKVVFTFNYKDGSRTITLQEVEGSDLGAGGAPERIGLFFAKAKDNPILSLWVFSLVIFCQFVFGCLHIEHPLLF